MGRSALGGREVARHDEPTLFTAAEMIERRGAGEPALCAMTLLHMATFRSASTLLSSDGTKTRGTVALFAEPARKGGVSPWAGDFRPANDAGNGPKNAVGKTF